MGSSTDPNNQTATFTYDYFDRPLVETRPTGGGSTTYSFNDPARLVSRSVTIGNGVGPLASEFSYDGLGRVTQARLTSDPQGTVKVDTTYDAVGRKKTITNAYRSTSDPTYGITQLCYDGLGRIRTVTPPDGTPPAADCTGGSNLIRTDYSGNTVTVTDQAGKQRRSYTDGLGRLIRVDEPAQGMVGGSPGTGSVTINGSEQSVEDGEWVEECALWDMEGYCLEWEWVWYGQTYWDNGGVSITVNGFSKSVSYGSDSTGGTIASELASAFNADQPRRSTPRPMPTSSR